MNPRDGKFTGGVEHRTTRLDSIRDSSLIRAYAAFAFNGLDKGFEGQDCVASDDGTSSPTSADHDHTPLTFASHQERNRPYLTPLDDPATRSNPATPHSTSDIKDAETPVADESGEQILAHSYTPQQPTPASTSVADAITFDDPPLPSSTAATSSQDHDPDTSYTPPAEITAAFPCGHCNRAFPTARRRRRHENQRTTATSSATSLAAQPLSAFEVT